MTGIYILTNKINNKKYVGQSVNIDLRNKRHHKDSIIDRAVRKYGRINFSIEKFACSENNLDWLEKEWIKYLDCLIPKGYNILEGGQNNKHHLTKNQKENLSLKLKGVRKSEITRLSMKENHADFSGEKNPMFGKKQSEKTKSEIREKNKDKTFSNEALSKMSVSAKVRTKRSSRDEKGRYCQKPIEIIAKTPGAIRKIEYSGSAAVEVETFGNQGTN
jgi:group I intron endonuclease